MPTRSKQKNIVSNTARGLIFVEDDELCFNYLTGQWTRVPAYDGLGLFSISDDEADIGVNRFSGTAVDLQKQRTSAPQQDALVQTAEADINVGGKAQITGIRPLISSGDAYARAGVRDSLNETARTNELTYSEALSNWSGITTNVTITDNDAVAPNGTTTATKIEATATASTNFAEDVSSVGDGTNGMIYSIYAKQGSGANDMDRFLLRNNTAGTNVNSITFDYSDGSFTQSGTGSDISVYVEDVGNNWWYIELFSGGADWSDNDNARCYAGQTGTSETAGNYCHAWGSSLMAATARKRNTYVKTSGATATEDVHWSRWKAANTRTGVCNIRHVGGRYNRIEVASSDGFNALQGADVIFRPAGRV